MGDFLTYLVSVQCASSEELQKNNGAPLPSPVPVSPVHIGFEHSFSGCDRVRGGIGIARFFGAEHSLVESELIGGVYASPRGAGRCPVRGLTLCHSLHDLKQASRQFHHDLARGLRGLSFQQCDADACAMRLVEAGVVFIVVCSTYR